MNKEVIVYCKKKVGIVGNNDFYKSYHNETKLVNIFSNLLIVFMHYCTLYISNASPFTKEHIF